MITKNSSRPLTRLLIILAVIATFGAESIATAQSFATISYQGLLQTSGGPVRGNVDIDITYYYTATGAPIVSESFIGVPVTNGTFDVELGSRMGGIPARIDLTQPVEFGVRINGGPELAPRSQIHAVPYAMMSHSLDGILVSPTPVSNKLFPIPLDEHNKIASSILPALSINGLEATNNNITIAAGPNISVTKDAENNRLLITGLGITSIGVRDGIVGSNINGVTTVGLDIGNLQGNWLLDHSISGLKMSTTFPGEGVYIDAQGTLGIAMDHNQFNFVSNRLHLRTDAPVTGTTGTLQTLNVQGDVLLNSNGDAPTTIMGPLNAAGGIDVLYHRVTNVGNPVLDDDAANANYVDQSVASVRNMLPSTGTIGVYSPANWRTSATVTINDPTITPTSVINVTVMKDGHTPSLANYVAMLSNLQPGSVSVTLVPLFGLMRSGEGATVHYVIYNLNQQQGIE